MACVEITYTAAVGSTPSSLSVRLGGTTGQSGILVYQETGVAPLTGYISLQSHWGSGVTFSDINLS